MTRTTLRLNQLEGRDNPAVGFSAFGAAPGGAPLVTVQRADNSTLAQFAAFESTFRGGVRAAAAELDGNPNTQEVVVGAGPGGGPAVKVFSVDLNTGAVTPVSAFFAFEESFRGGVRVAAGTFATTPDGRQQIVVGAGEGGGPRVRVLDVGGSPIGNSPLADFFAYEPTFRGGVQVAAGELDGNPATGDELVVAAGTGGGPRVRIIRSDGAVLADYFAFDSTFRGGANVTVETTGGLVGRLRVDALALDPSQRSAALNRAAASAVAAATGTTQTGGVNSLGAAQNTGGVVNNTALGGGGIGLATAGDGFAAAATGTTGIARGVGGVGGIGTTATGTTGIGSVVGAAGLGGATGAGGISGTTTGGGLSTGTLGLNPSVGPGTGVSAATGVTAVTAGTGPAVQLPSVTAFGPFGDPGTAVATPPLANPPFARGVTRYTIPV
jgi:hypothetical protein